jgi:hypothetical protein
MKTIYVHFFEQFIRVPGFRWLIRGLSACPRRSLPGNFANLLLNCRSRQGLRLGQRDLQNSPSVFVHPSHPGLSLVRGDKGLKLAGLAVNGSDFGEGFRRPP